jgi:hypothetical protein
MDDDKPQELQLIVISKEKDNVDSSSLFVQHVQILDIALPQGYEHPIHVPSSKFHKMCKNMASIGQVVELHGSSEHARFFAETAGIFKKDISFGEFPAPEETVHHQFDIEQFSRISKISGLSPILYLHLDQELPLLIKAQVGALGNISLYIKPKKM